MTLESTPRAAPLASSVGSPPATGSAVLDSPADGTAFPWGNALGVVLGLVLLWTGLRRIELSGYWKGLLSLLDLAVLIYSIANLGLIVGTILVVVANLLLFLLTAIRAAMRHEDVLAHAAAVSGSDLSEMKALATRLRRGHKVFGYLGPMTTARLIDHLSDRARTVAEIEEMAPPIAMLWLVDRPDLGKVVDDFDRLLRLWSKSASEAMAVADTLTATRQHSRMTLQEALDGLIAIAEGGTLRPAKPSHSPPS